MDLIALLESKPLYYKEFDPKRIVEAYQILEPHIKHPRRVQLIGTNAKGSTGRAIAHLASKSGLSVGHYTSPHILDFKERFWINGEFATTNELESAHQKLYSILGKEISLSLSYFEYLTLLAFVLFENCDLQVVEAGLGGEYDATSVAKYNLTVVTPIGVDHSDFLGNTIEEIATTKLKAIAPKALLAKQEYEEVYTVAQRVAKEKGSRLYFYTDSDTRQSIVATIAKSKGWANYLVENITTALRALDILEIAYNIYDLNSLQLFGRFYPFAQNIWIDVGHNTLAAKAIVQALPRRVVLIFNILSDKDAKEVLKILKPKIESVLLIDIETQRSSDMQEIKEILEDLAIAYREFDNHLDPKKEYLVFGSFYTVEAFLRSQGVESIESK